MFKIALLLLTLFLTGCAERGYILTNNTTTHTVTAENITSINNKSSQSDTSILKKMTKEVKKTLKKQKIGNSIPTKKPKVLKKKKSNPKTTLKIKKQQPKIETLEKKIKILKKENKVIPNVAITDDENALKEEARKSQERREAKLRELHKLNELAKQKVNIVQTEPTNKVKKTDTQKAIAATTVKDSSAEKRLVEEREKELARKAMKLEKERQLREKRLKEISDRKLQKVASNKTKIDTTETLIFKQIDKIYHKFGTSEVHGHVIYLTTAGQETRLPNTKVYLLPVSAKLNHWYSNYYLKNKNNGNSTIVNYLNKTSLNLERNFSFFGVPKGSYYVIIESDYPASMGKNKKVYIAKKIQVGKYKKIMGVFSKKL